MSDIDPPTPDQRRANYEERQLTKGERRVSARFQSDDLIRLRALGVVLGCSEAQALRVAVQTAFETLVSNARAGTPKNPRTPLPQHQD